MPPIEMTFDTIEDAPEALRGALEERDGKFVFQGESVREIANLKTTLDKERQARNAAAKQLKSFEGIDPEDYRRLKELEENAKAEEAKSKGNWEERENQLKTQLQRELTNREKQFQVAISERDSTVALLRANLEKSMIENQAISLIAAERGVPELLMPHIMRQVQLIDEDGEYSIQVVDSAGQPRIADLKGTPFTLKDLVREMKLDPIYGRAFESTGAGGSGANANNRASTNKQMTRATFDTLSNADKVTFIKNGGSITD